MDLLLWRHADAADGSPDLARPLTERGHGQARAMAEWLHKRLPAGLRVLSSPARRAQETAAALGLPVEVLDELAPEARPSALIAAAGWPNAPQAVLIVGHQPTLGETAAALLGAKGREVPVRKGAVLWIRSARRSVRDVPRLVAVIEPEMLSKGDATL
ncbi:MAG: histidine phosphatase family protein [Steroidobacteraceae bacterium]